MRPEIIHAPRERTIYNKIRDEVDPCVVYVDDGVPKVTPLRTPLCQELLTTRIDVVVGLYDYRVRMADLRSDILEAL